MTRAEEFERLRPLLFAIAYRILGRVTEAEDAVQETWLRWDASAAPPASTKAFLSVVVTRSRSTCCARLVLSGRPTLGPTSPNRC
jgi:RNA polymerase sigma-70 factor (ECF subfamily)